MVLKVVNYKAVLAHLLETVLEIDPTDTTALAKKGGFKSYPKHCKITDTNMEVLYNSNHNPRMLDRTTIFPYVY